MAINMCGIAGFTGRKNDVRLAIMVRRLIHRGPDDEGFYSDENVSLGMRRLSIIDLSTGRQPIFSENENVVTVFNGEIYNFLKLRNDLVKKGHRFSTNSDTEIIVHLYQELGNKFVDQLDGMFGIALWDKKKKKLILTRDRFGKKPLYYTQIGRQLVFASEIKSILEYGVKKEINFEALHHYFSLKHIPDPLTIYKNVYSLPAGSCLVFQKEKIKIKKYWQLDYNTINPRSELKIIDKLDYLLNQAVAKRLVSDVPIGAYLSGGLDSSLVVALFSRLAQGRIKTFFMTYQGDFSGKENDRKFAGQIAKKYKTDHYEYVMKYQELADSLEGVLSAFDQPFAGVISTYFISQLIKKHVKVAISGDGADELFASYLVARLAFPIDNYLKNNGKDIEALKPFNEQIDFLKSIADKPEWRWRSKLVVFNEKEKRELYQNKLLEQLDKCSTVKLYRNYFRSSTATDPLNRVLDVDCKTVLTDQVLPFVDRLSMAHSIEVRCPFLDYQLAEYAAGLPGQWKIRQGETKYILKKLGERYLPQKLVYRPKEGFIMPINDWLMNKMEKQVKNILSVRRLEKHNLFNQDIVKNLVECYYSKRLINNSNKIWSLLMFQLWWENNIK